LEKVTELDVKPGSGPRTLVLHPNAKYVYIMTELPSEVIFAEYDEATGALKVIQTIASLTEGLDKENKGSAIHISPDG
ncbi:beta-propeller fold lactonase family protein, partial [Listeria monocytogenes]|nr:beta-propeller fold lactonase family protein [Listeria monocytogenes]